MNSRHGFGPRLRAERESRGITLTSIAESTKIKRSLFEALERSDVSQWPRGLFRRAYIRNYARAVGLAPEPLVEEFGRLFPESGIGDDGVGRTPGPLRMTLAGEPNAGVMRAGSRALRAAGEIAMVLVLGAFATLAVDVRFWAACGAVALIYYPVMAALTGRTPDPQQLRALFPRRRQAVGEALVAARDEHARIYVVTEQRASTLPFVHAVAGEEYPQQHHASH